MIGSIQGCLSNAIASNNDVSKQPAIRFKARLQEDVFVKSIPNMSFTGKKTNSNMKKTIEYYDKNADQYFETTKAIDMEEQYKPFLNLLPSNAKILDAGCGAGRDSKAFLEKGYDVTAIDASKELAKKASKHIGQNVLPLRFDELKFKEEFDGIWACASLLHVPKEEFQDSLQHLSDALKPGGIMFASIKKGEGESFDKQGRFFSYFSEKEFKDIVNNIKGLEVVQVLGNEDKLNRKDTVWMSIILKKIA